MFNKFIGKANKAHQQFCLWFSTNNEFAKYQAQFTSRELNSFFSVVVPTLQHSWVLATARLFDKAYYNNKDKNKPRTCLDYILIQLENDNLANEILEQLKSHQVVINSVKNFRDNFITHNDVNFILRGTRIEPGIENLFQWLEDTIAKIKKAYPHLNECGTINIEHNEKLLQCDTEAVFETLLRGEKS